MACQSKGQILSYKYKKKIWVKIEMTKLAMNAILTELINILPNNYSHKIGIYYQSFWHHQIW